MILNRMERRIPSGQLVGDVWAKWYSMTPRERWSESSKLWATYLALGGSLEPEPDTHSPFSDAAKRYWAPLVKELEQMRLNLSGEGGLHPAG